MSVITTVELDADGFLLGDALAADPDLRVRLERVVPLGGPLVPYFRADDDSVEAIERALETADDVDDFHIVDRVDSEALVRAEWAASEEGLPWILGRSGVTLLDGTGRRGRWHLDLRFEDHDALERFYRRCTERELAPDVQQVHDNGGRGGSSLEGRLTAPQREALELALAEGYFEVPRRIDLDELGERLGISDTAVSQRLRRGIAAALAGLEETE